MYFILFEGSLYARPPIEIARKFEMENLVQVSQNIVRLVLASSMKSIQLQVFCRINFRFSRNRDQQSANPR